MKQLKREKVYNKYYGFCAYCGERLDFKKFQVDHIHAKRNGGTDNLDNLNPSCRRCNNFKHSLTIEEFRGELQEQVRRGRERSVNFRMAERYGQIKVEESEIIFYFEKIVKEELKERLDNTVKIT